MKKPTSELPTGLRILLAQCPGRRSDTVVKPAVRLITPLPLPLPLPRYHYVPSYVIDESFLKSCHLCKKCLSPEKDVYMYRGDQGFCSTECRCRQIFIDEMEEIEKEMRAPSRHYCRTSGKIRSGHRRAIPAVL